VRGQAVDKRTDIWAFGCVLYEMLTGRPAFGGETMSDTFVSVLEREPDWNALPTATPTAIRTLLQRCLRKDPEKRLHDIADARIEIDECDLVAGPASLRTQPGPSLRWIAAALLVVSSLAAMLVLRLRAPSLRPSSSNSPLLLRRTRHSRPDMAALPSLQTDATWSSRRRSTSGQACGCGPSPRLSIGRFQGRTAPCFPSGNPMAARLDSSPGESSRRSRCAAASRASCAMHPTYLRDRHTTKWAERGIATTSSCSCRAPSRCRRSLHDQGHFPCRLRRSERERPRIAGPRFFRTDNIFFTSRSGNQANRVTCGSDRWTAARRRRSGVTNRMLCIPRGICSF
jgi:serine/threonine protein kinase